MASRMYIAAAGCMVASGLFMTGASTALAFADPESGRSGETGDTQAAGAASAGVAAAPGIDLGNPAGRTPTTRASAPADADGVVQKPASHVGDGRNGPEADRRGGSASEAPTGKRPDGSVAAPWQTPPTGSGEPVAAHPPRRPEGPGWGGHRPGPEPPAGEDADDPGTPHGPWEHHPGAGSPWWGPCPDHPDDPDDPGGPGLPPGGGVGSGSGNGGSGGGLAQGKPPSGRPNPPPEMQLPPPREVPPELPGISADPLAQAATGLATADMPLAPISLPGIGAPVAPAGAGEGGIGPRAGTPSAPRPSGTSPDGRPESNAGRPNPSAFSTGNGAPPESFRVGYGDYLRTAGVGQMMALAVPGVTGLLILTGAGGVLGYRQARAGRAMRASNTARFVG